jgi:hypothetical protein
MWVRSYFVADCLNLGKSAAAMQWHGSSWGRRYRLESGAGRVQLVIDDSWPAGGKMGAGLRWSSGFVEPSWLTGSAQPFMGGAPKRTLGAVGFEYAVYQGIPPLSSYRPIGGEQGPLPVLGRRMVAPYWFIVLLTGIAGFRSLRVINSAWNERRKRRAGLCAKCGYDLRATPERCPECGTQAIKAER